MNTQCTYLCRIVLIGLALLMLQGCVLVSPGLFSHKSEYLETTVEEADSFWTMNKIALLDISGVITKDYNRSLWERGSMNDPVGDIKEALEKAEKDSSVKAVILRIDSPGGVVSWCDVMFREIQKFKEKSNKPVLAAIMSVGASGGYYVSLAADEIYVSPAGVTGSIGVIAVFVNVEELADKIGIQAQVIKSGDKKDMGSFWREMSKEEQTILQGIIDEYYQRLVNLIVENRDTMDQKTITELADGRVFTAQQAKDAGFIDGVLYLDEVIERAKTVADIKDARVVMYYRQFDYKNNIYSSYIPQQPSLEKQDVNLLKVNVGLTPSSLSPGFYYLWLPGIQ